MEWSTKQRAQHRKAAGILDDIKNRAFTYVAEALAVRRQITEYDLCQWVIHEFGECGLILDLDPPIVAFGPSAAAPHYNPLKEGNRVITQGNVLLLDIWGKLDDPDAPFADITWMAWTGGPIPQDVQKAFDAVLIARDAGLRYLEKNMDPEMHSKDVDEVVRASLRARGLDTYFIHGTGHHLDSKAVHGGAYTFKADDERLLIPFTGATIEPGVYIEGKFGIRSECDIFLQEKTIEITTPLQTDWVLLTL